MNITFPAKITKHPEDGRYNVQFLDFEEAITEGATLKEALFNASEILTLTLEGRIDEKMPMPLPTQIKGKNIYSIPPSARVQASLLIRNAKKNWTNAKLARAMDTSWPAIARMENPRHWPALRQLEKTARITGHQLVISFSPPPMK